MAKEKKKRGRPPAPKVADAELARLADEEARRVFLDDTGSEWLPYYRVKLEAWAIADSAERADVAQEDRERFVGDYRNATECFFFDVHSAIRSVADPDLRVWLRSRMRLLESELPYHFAAKGDPSIEPPPRRGAEFAIVRDPDPRAPVRFVPQEGARVHTEDPAPARLDLLPRHGPG